VPERRLDSSSHRIRSLEPTTLESPTKLLPFTTRAKARWTSGRGVNEVLRTYRNMDPVYCSPSDDEIGAAYEQAMKFHDAPMPRSSVISYYFLMKLPRSTE